MKQKTFLLMFLILLLGISTIAMASTVTVGSGTTTNGNIPIVTNWGYTYSQQIYTPAQITRSGEIQRLSFYKASGTITNSSEWTVYMGHTSKTQFSTTSDWEPVANLTQVFSGSLSFPSAEGWIEITLDTPFNYDNVSNLIIAVDENTPNYGSSVSWRVFSSTTNTAIYYRSDSTNPSPVSPPVASGRLALVNQLQLGFPVTTPPNAAITPNPVHNAINVGTNPTLTWFSGGGAPTSYDVYFGADNPPSFIGNQVASTYSPTGLSRDTEYFWQIVPRNANGPAEDCPVWSFRTVPEGMAVIGTGSLTTLNLPLNPYFGYNYTQTLYLQSEIDIRDMRIEKIYYYWNGLAAGPNLKDWTIYMGHTDKTVFSSTSDWVPLASMSQVFNGEVILTASPGWVEINLTAPFIYNNSDNLVIAVNETTPSYGGQNEKFLGTNTGTNRSLRLQNDTVVYNPASPAAGTLEPGIANIMMLFGELPEQPVFFYSPGSLAFSPVKSGTMSSAMNVTVSNTGAGHLILDGRDVSLAGDDGADFSFDDANLPADLASGQNLVIPVRFTPQSAGQKNAILLITYDGEDYQVTLSGYAYPETYIFEGFEATTFPPAGWANPGTWSRSTFTVFEGLGSATKAATNSILSTPKLQIADGDKLMFMARLTNTTAALEVIYSTDRTSWTVLQSVSASTANLWFPVMVNLNIPAKAGDYYLGFRTSGSATYNIDNVIMPEYAREAPGIVTLSSPINAATNQSIRPTLSWTPNALGGVPTSYEIYLESTVTPVAPEANPRELLATVTTTSYALTANLDFGTTYIWKVVAINEHGSSEDSVVRSFSTISGKASITSPLNNAQTVAISSRKLDWSDVANATGYKISVGTTVGGTDIANMVDCSISEWTKESNWEYNTNYYWRVYTLNGTQMVEGDPWNFKTMEDPTRSLPYVENFNASTAYPANWSGNFTIGTTGGATGNGLFRNLFGSTTTAQVISPPVGPLGATSVIEFDYRYTQYTGHPATAYPLEEGDKIDVQISTDAGATFETIYTINQSNHTNTNQFTPVSVYLTQAKEITAGSVIVARLLATRTASAVDYYLSIDNIGFRNIFQDAVFSIDPAVKAFGTISVGSNASQTFTIRNQGLSALTIESVALTGDTGQFTLINENTYPVVLGASEAMQVGVVFAPSQEGNFSATLSIIDDLASKATRTVSITGIGSDANNYGGGDAESVAGGYYFANNLSVGAQTTPSFVWNHVSQNELNLANLSSGSEDDGFWGPINIGFPFLFYGTQYEQLYFNTNGLISFGAGSTSYSNVAIPSAAAPNNMIALFWDDLEYYPGFSQVHYNSIGSAFLISMVNMGRTGSAYDPANSVSAQAILFADGKIKLQYQNIVGTHTPTIGIENATGTKGLQYHFNGVGGPYTGGAKAGIAVMFGDNPATLPVTLSSFTAVLTSDLHVKIAWIAESEVNHSGYNIFRSELNDIATAVRVNASILDNGTENGTQITYAYTDSEVYQNATYFYWLESVSLDGVTEYYGPLTVTINAGGEQPGIPQIPLQTQLFSAFPNPFNPSTNLRYSMKEAGDVRIDVFNAKGQLLKSFNNNHNAPGYYQVNWDGRDANGRQVSTGVYFYRMTSGKYTATKKMVLSK